MRAYLRTFGCTFNKFDSELIKYALEKNGFKLVKSPEEADVIIVNTCGVKKQTEDRIISYLKKVEKFGKRLIITGCLPLINLKRLEKEIKFFAVTGPAIGEKIIDLINGKAPSNNLLRNDFFPSLSNRKYGEGIIHITPLCHGCLGNCSYCAVKFARGRLRSYPQDDIIRDIECAVRNGAKEIWITAQDTGSYGLDIGTDLISLLKKVDRINGEFFVRIGMMNPSRLPYIVDDLIVLFKESNKFFYFLHLPVQSGSPRVLRLMRRNYDPGQLLEYVKRIRKEVDEKFNIMTDVIVGHPGETERDFLQTIELIKELRPDVVNISKFFPRPYTEASKMPQLPSQVIKRRSVELTKLCNQISKKRNEKWIKWTGKVLIDEKGKNGTLIARNYAYKPVIIKKKLKLGTIVSVEIEEAHPYWLKAHLLNNPSNGFRYFPNP
ncbi:threonylcarbamoyladenosine tRNA methylthiotransferase [Candidatus Geothermarchaeota archaeon]|nr:MAG: threonylcarbamoyladenosine tRNA methylthiotransferase [Candidatus Geothermarchaeota archaeon]